MILLGVNVDHVATVRQARYREAPDGPNVEPDPVIAALAAESGGADGITIHLRADRRHILDGDVNRMRAAIATKLNLEMGNTPEILAIALAVKPDDVCLVPENRREVTTEGGLDCDAGKDALAPTVHALRDAGIAVSLFIDPEPRQVRSAVGLGADFIELHTGAFANATGSAREVELTRLITASELGHHLGLKINAGHGINYTNIGEVLRIPHLHELNIGHSIISRALAVGIGRATREMRDLIRAGE